MKRFPLFANMLIALALAFAAVPNFGVADAMAQGGATATDESVYESELSGLEVAVSGDFVIDNTELQQYERGEGELVHIDGEAAFLRVAFFDFDDTGDPADTVELFNEGFASEMDSFTVLDEDLDNSPAWSFSISTIEDEEVLLYIEVVPDVVDNVDVVTLIAAPSQSFFEDIQLAQENVTVDGEGIFPDVDVADLEDTYDQGQGESRDEDAADEDAAGDAEEEDSAATNDGEDRRTGARLPGDKQVDEAEDLEEESEEEAKDTGRETGQSDFEDAGLVSDNEYISPQFDTPVEWGEQWFIDFEDPESVTSDTAGEMDSLFLVWAGEGSALLYIDIAEAGEITPDDFLEYWISDEYLEENADPSAEILLDDGGPDSGSVLMRDFLSDGEEILILKEAVLLEDGTIVIATLIGTPETFGEAHADAADDVVVGDEAIFTVFSERDIEAETEP